MPVDQAHELEYEYFAEEIHEGFPIMPRGWQYWENIAVEIGISEPFLTHLGFDLRIGVDPSEISDFILGIFTIDYNHDDLTMEGLRILYNRNKPLKKGA